MTTTVKITETGKIETLNIIDPYTGTDYSADLLGNHDAFNGFDDADDINTMSREDYDWWAELLPRLETAESAAHDYHEFLCDGDDFIDQLNHLLGRDLENLPEAIMDAIEQHREMVKARGDDSNENT